MNQNNQGKNNRNQKSFLPIIFPPELHKVSDEIYAIDAQLKNLETKNMKGNSNWQELQSKRKILIEKGLAIRDKETVWLCSNCSDNLFGKPKIDLEGVIYCFRYAKQAVNSINSERYKIKKRIYESQKQEYDLEKANHQKAMAEWFSKQTSFIEQYKIGFWQSVGIIFTLGFIVNTFYPGTGLGFFVLIGTAVIWFILSSKITQKRELQFRETNPIPIFDGKEPKLYSSEVSYVLIDPDGSKFNLIKYRDEIFDRDNFTCQKCGKKETSDKLEAHHIKPVVSGGLDDPTNLITLCINCHDREDWYGHFRKYPTTIYSYIGVRRSKIYHERYCKRIRKSTDPNLIIFNSIKEAKASGYRSCSLCKPK
jgi:hypothetical protein